MNNIQSEVDKICIGERRYEVLTYGSSDNYITLKDITVVNYSNIESDFVKSMAKQLFNSYRDVNPSTGNYYLKYSERTIKRFIFDEISDVLRKCSQVQNLKMTKIFRTIRDIAGDITYYNTDSENQMLTDMFNVCEYYHKSINHNGVFSEVNKKNIFNLICIIGEKHGQKPRRFR
jgi:hypothetical protein